MALTSFGTWLREELERQGKTQAALARHCGTSTQSVSAWVKHSIPRNSALIRISEFLGIELKTLEELCAR